MSADQIFIPSKKTVPFSLDLLGSSSNLTVKVTNHDLLLIRVTKGWLLKIAHQGKSPQALDDLCSVWRYFREEGGWGGLLGIDKYTGGNIIYLYPPKDKNDE